MTVWDDVVGQPEAVAVLSRAARAAVAQVNGDLFTDGELTDVPRSGVPNSGVPNSGGPEGVDGQVSADGSPAGGSPAGGDSRERDSPGGMTHAWLLTGPPGSGRSTAARAFAAALQCPDAGCGQCHACRTALSGGPRRRHPGGDRARLPAGRGRQAADHPRPAAPVAGPVAGDRDRGRRPAQRHLGQPAAEGDRGATAAHGVAAVRAKPRTTSWSRSGPGAGRSGCGCRRWPTSRRCWYAGTASTRRWRPSPPGPRTATSGWPGGWPSTRERGSGAVRCCKLPRAGGRRGGSGAGGRAAGRGRHRGGQVRHRRAGRRRAGGPAALARRRRADDAAAGGPCPGAPVGGEPEAAGDPRAARRPRPGPGRPAVAVPGRAGGAARGAASTWSTPS